MKSILVFSTAFVVSLSPWARGQHVLVIKDGDQPRVVVGARDITPLVLENGKPTLVHASRFALVEGGEYLPLFVAVRHPQVKTSSLRFTTGDEVNRTFHFYCDLETAFPLANVFLVIVLNNDRSDRGLFLYEIGRLEPRHARPISVAVPMVMDNAPGRYRLYLFSGGRELFQSMMPFGAMESSLNKLVREHIKDVVDSPPRPFLGPTPEYPRTLRKKKIGGSATVSFAIGVNGAVSDPALVESSRPEFGEAALAVIQQWRFLPEVKHGHPVATRAQLPFDFSPD